MECLKKKQRGCLHNLSQIDLELAWVSPWVIELFSLVEMLNKTFLNNYFTGMSKQLAAVKLVTEMCGNKAKNCDASVPFRSIDGTCNNLKNGWLGAMSTPFRRDVKPVSWDVEDISTSLVDLTTLFGTDRVGNVNQKRALN